MPPSNSNRSQHSQQFNALIAEYELADEQGRALDPEEFVQQHPDFAAELRQYFADVWQLQGWIGPPQAHLTATMEVGLKIRDYQVLDKIGAGGMGTVYLAMHTRLKKTVALKIMKADRERDSQAIARFELEMEAVGKLEHPHIVRAMDAGDEAGTHFLVMEFLDGCDLGRLLKFKGRLELPLACELIRQAALGLQHAHDHNLVHRDVKPSNLMLSASGQVKVLDLGLAQLQASIEEPGDQTRAEHAGSGAVKSLTREGQFVGTWRYMAPEQFLTSRQVDSRADIFSLGVTFYCFLVGELPLGPGQTAAYLPPIARLRPDVPPDVQMLLAQMLALNQEERIQTMTEVANVLQTYAMQGSVNILAIGASLELAKQGISNALEGTQSWSSTADDVEIIPPPVVPRPPPLRVNKRSTGFKESEALAYNRETLLASIFAIITVAMLGLLIFSHSAAKNWERDLAAARIAELQGITARALQCRDLVTAEVCVLELVTHSNKFPTLLDLQTVSGFQETIRQQKSAAQSRLKWEEAYAGRQWDLLAPMLATYLKEPYATDKTEAELLLKDVRFLIAERPNNQARVADWTVAKLAEFLKWRKLPPEITIADEAVRASFRTDLLKLATLERDRRRDEAVLKFGAEEVERTERLQQEADQRLEADRKRALELQRLDDEAKLEWPRHPERHGILALIPQDAIGAVGVASTSQMLRSCQEIDREILRKISVIRTILRLFWFQEPEVFSLEKAVRKELETAPLGCYQQDQPVAIVFANPERAHYKLPVENLNALSAIWKQPIIEKLGVVVGKPIDLRAVEQKLELPAGSLEEGKIQTSRLWRFMERKTVFSLIQDGRLYVGLSYWSVKAVADSLHENGSLALDTDLPPREAAHLASMDLLVHFGPGAWKEEWKQIASEMRKRLAEVNDDPETLKLADDLDEIARRAKAFLLGVKLDQGVQASLLVFLADDDEALLDRFQQVFSQGNAPLSLVGLPQEGAIGAFATRGNGLSGAAIAQSLLLLSQQPYLFPDVHFPTDKNQRDKLSLAFQEVWNEVQGTRTGNYYGAMSTIIVLDTSDPKLFIRRLQELVTAWDEVSLELAGRDADKARYRFAIPVEKFDGLPAYRLTLSVRGQEPVTTHKLWIVPVGNQMVLSYENEDPAFQDASRILSPLRRAIKDLQSGEGGPALAMHPGILVSEPKLPASRKIEVYLWLSEIRKLAQGNQNVGDGSAEYSSASLTLGRNSILLDAWVPLNEIIKNRDLIQIGPELLPPMR